MSAVARARCAGEPTSVLNGARGFVFLGDKYAADAPIRCPKCRRKFYPGDTLDAGAVPRSIAPRAPEAPAARM